MILRPRNWREFQHYTKRRPPWIKLHHKLLDDRAFLMLPVASRALALMLWLLASERDDGSIKDAIAEIVVIFVYREEYYLEHGSPEERKRLGEVAGRAELHVAKQRHGPTGLVRVMFDGPTTRFSDVDRSDR